MEWVAAHFADADIKQINKADIKWTSKAEALARVRALNPEVFAAFTADLDLQSGRGALKLFAVLAGSRRVVMGDTLGRTVSRSRLGVLLLDTPRLALELLVGYGLIVPLCWLLTEALGVSLVFRGVSRASRINVKKRVADQEESSSALYIRATLAGAKEGGMTTHVAGFASGAAALGHRLKFLVSDARHNANEDIAIPPSRVFSATKALFELWNNLSFTARSLQLIASGDLVASEFDFIYQRYSRFNWTGVALSLITGLPLLLEFNGSEVWVSRRWDPIGQLLLLKRFEQINQRAADLIFVVSEVERRNAIRAGASPEKIIVNPNGVDTDRFRPGCGGLEIRRATGIEDKIVVGFVGTFGPWHGAPVLAEAARLVNPQAGCHFLFIGDGEERAETESIIEAGVSATFTGRVSHDNVPAYLDACDILIAPHVASSDGSEFFGSPTKLFEYMAMEKTIVASRLGQLAEVIDDQENGMLVEPGKTAVLARAIESLANAESLRSRLGAAARQTVINRFTWKHNAARVIEAAENLR